VLDIYVNIRSSPRS